MPLFLKNIEPDIDVFGNRQNLHFNNEDTPTDNEASFALINHFNPNATASMHSGFEMLSKQLKGYRLFHELDSGSNYGNFALQSYSRFEGSDDIFKYNESTDKVTFYKDVEFAGGGGGGSGVTSIGITGSVGLNVSNSPITSSGNIGLSLSSNLENLSSFSGSGFISRNSSGNYLGRSLQAGNGIAITNPDGVSGNPIISATGSSSGVTLTGAVTGSGSSTVETTMGENQMLPFHYLRYNWDSPTYRSEKGVFHTLADSSDTPPHFVHLVEAGSGDTYRRWLTVYQPGFGSSRSAKYELGFFHSSGGHEYPFTIQTYGSSLRTYIRTTVDINNNQIINLLDPVSSQDAATKNFVENYVDNAINSLITPSSQSSILHGYVSSSYTDNISSGDHIKFSAVSFSRGSNISLDTSSSYTTSNNAASIGRITLLAGKTYKLVGSINNISSTSYNATRWYNSDTGAPIGLNSGSASPTSSIDRVPSATTIAYITTSTNTRVELRSTWNTFTQVRGTNDAIGPAWFTVEEV